MWALSAAVTLGVLVVTVAGGLVPPWWFFVLLVALLTTITLAGRLLGNGGNRKPKADRGVVSKIHGALDSLLVALHATIALAGRLANGMIRYRASPLHHKRHDRGEGTDGRASPTEPVKGARKPAADWDVVSEIYCALDSRQLAWLRSNDFGTPWHDSDARRAMDIEPLVAEVVDGAFAPDLCGALRILSDAIKAFSEFYAHDSAPDPLVIGGEWRFIEEDDPGATEEDGIAGDRAGRAAHLHLLATELADAYEGFRAIAAGHPKLRARTAMLV
jgi:hypothetical protein